MVNVRFSNGLILFGELEDLDTPMFTFVSILSSPRKTIPFGPHFLDFQGDRYGQWKRDATVL